MKIVEHALQKCILTPMGSFRQQYIPSADALQEIGEMFIQVVKKRKK